MLVAAAEAIANCVSAEALNASYIVPSVFNPEVTTVVAAAVERVARAQDEATRGRPHQEPTAPAAQTHEEAIRAATPHDGAIARTGTSS